MTNVIPIAITPTTLACTRIARRLLAVGKSSGSRIAPTMISTTITAPSVYCWSSSPFIRLSRSAI